MRCAILSIDRDGRLMLCNELATQILDLDQAPAAGTPVEVALAEHPQMVQVLRESFEMTCLPNRAELDLRRPGGRGKTIGFTLSMVSDPRTDTAGAAMFFRDLTQIEQKEEQERLKDRLAALGQMAASLAHEIRNPLASIEVTCSLLGRRLDANDHEHELLDKITAEVRRLNRTITSSLEFVRPISPTFAPGELEPMLEEAIAVAEKRRNDPDIRIEKRFGPPIPAFLIDRAQLRQVFENLLVNAVQAVDAPGRIVVETAVIEAPEATIIPYRPGDDPTPDLRQEVEHYAVVRVTDNGPGIPDHERDKIFYPFFTTKKHGSGIGLSTVKKIVDSHRGLVDVDDAPGGGALLTVRLPIVQRAAEAESR